MNKSIIIKSLLNGVASCLAFALIHSLIWGVPFMQTLVEPYTLTLGPFAAAGSYMGYRIRTAKQ